MKKIFLILKILIFGMGCYAQNKKDIENKKDIFKKFDLGLVFQIGIANADRQPLNNAISDRSTYPRFIGFYNQIGLACNHKKTSGNVFHTYTFSHNVLGYGSKIHDTRFSITKGGDAILSDIYYSYRYFNFSYIYNRQIFKIKNKKVYAGLGISLNFLYNLKKNLYLKDGNQEVSLSSGQINNNSYINNMPTFLLKISTHFDIFTLKNVQAAFTYRKDLHYLAMSTAPIFSAYGVGLHIPIFNF